MDEQKPRRGPGRPASGQPQKGSYSYRADRATKERAEVRATAEGTTLSRLIEGWLADYAEGRHSSR